MGCRGLAIGATADWRFMAAECIHAVSAYGDATISAGSALSRIAMPTLSDPFLPIAYGRFYTHICEPRLDRATKPTAQCHHPGPPRIAPTPRLGAAQIHVLRSRRVADPTPLSDPQARVFCAALAAAAAVHHLYIHVRYMGPRSFSCIFFFSSLVGDGAPVCVLRMGRWVAVGMG